MNVYFFNFERKSTLHIKQPNSCKELITVTVNPYSKTANVDVPEINGCKSFNRYLNYQLFGHVDLQFVIFVPSANTITLNYESE